MEVLVDLPFWSLMTVVVFGFVTKFLSTVMDPTIAQYLYLGTLMWEIMRVTQYSMSLGALWNVWSHNFSNMFITPLSMLEYVLAQMLSAAVKAVLLFGVVALIAAAFVRLQPVQHGPRQLALAFLNLLWFAYSIGLFILGIIFRLGTRIQALAWGLVLIFQPLTAAFYPLSVMPPVLQAIALLFPPTYAFEAARAALSTPEVDVGVGRHRQRGERDLFCAVGVVLHLHVPPLARDGPVRAQRGIGAAQFEESFGQCNRPRRFAFASPRVRMICRESFAIGRSPALSRVAWRATWSSSRPALSRPRSTRTSARGRPRRCAAPRQS